MGINLPCGNTPLTTTECGGDCDEKIERLAERVSEAEDKLDTIQEGAEVNVNADWEETDPNSDAYIENKPSVNYDLSLGDSAPTVGSAVVGSAVLGTLVDIILGRGDGTEDRVSVSGTGAIQITRDGDTMTIHVPVGEIDQLRNGTDTEARAWAANVLKQWLDERIAQIPADQFLDLNKTVFANPFTWSSTTYPGSINPNLDGKPVLVLALTDGENVSYSFLNMEDLIDAYEGVAPISVNGSQISHDNSGVTAGSYGDSSNQTPNFGDTFKALRSTVDAKGHVTSMSEHTVKIPDTLATQESAGLMSAEDKEKLDNVDQLYKTTCGNPIVIDDADGEVKALNVELTPIQDLHGYDKPWAAGAGKNLLNIGGRVNQTTAQVTYTSDDDYVILNGTKQGGGYANLSTLTITLPAGTYYAKAIPVSGTATANISIYPFDGSADVVGNILDSEKSFTLSEEKTFYFRFAVWTDGTVFTNYKIGIVISKTSGIDKFYPYENECPIYPHTSLPVRDTGKNLIPSDRNDYSVSFTGSYLYRNGVVPPNQDAVISFTDKDTSIDISGIYLGFIQNDLSSTGDTTRFRWVLNNGTPASDKSNKATQDASVKCENVFIYPRTDEAFNKLFARYDIQVELGTTATSYAPYTGQTVTVPLNDLYGGTVDVIGGESEETVRYLTIDGNTNIGKEATGWAQKEVFYIEIGTGTNKGKQTSYTEVCNIISNQRVATSYVGLKATTQSGEIAFTEYGRWIEWTSDSTSVAEEKTRLGASPLQIAYELATPTPLETTPTPLTLYKGDNVISSEGDMCITYLQDRGDLTDFINEMKACCEEVKGSLLENLVDGTAQGSLRGIDTTQEDANYTIGKDATALGNGTKASGDYSVAEGTQTEASGLHSHAEGVQTKAMQQAAHAEGAATTANALFAHSEGNATNATGRNAHAEGGGTTASEESAHAEGGSTTASAHSAHAEGGGTVASARNAHAEGSGTKAVSMSQHVGGEFNELDPTGSATTRGTYVEIIGNGASDTARSNARTLDWNGNEALQGGLTLGKGTADEVTITAAQLQQLLALI